MSNTVFNLKEQNIPHYEKNQPKLQWLIVLIPIMGAFTLYTFLHIYNKRKRARQRLVDGETLSVPPSMGMANVISAPAPTFHHTNNRITNNTIPSRIYDFGQRTYPLLRFSNDSYNNNTTILFWQRSQSSSHQPNSTDINDNAQQNRQGQRRRRMRDQRRSRRGELNRTPSPPPVYSISSPPKYEEVVALEQENVVPPNTSTSNNAE